VPPAAAVYDLIPLGAIRDVAPVGKPARDARGSPDTDDDESAGGYGSIPLKDSEAVPGTSGAKLPVDDPAAKFEVKPARELADGDFQKMVDKDADRQAAEAREQSRERQSQEARRKADAERKAAESRQREETPEYEPEPEPRLPLYRRVSPKVWVGLGVAAIIALTVRGQIRQNYRDRIPEIVKKARTDGLTSLDAGRFDEAKQILNDAAGAFDYLRENSDEAKEIRQAAREASILADLVGRPLDEIIDRFAAGEAGKADFRNLDKGRSLVVEARITATPEQGGGYDLDFRVPVGPGPNPARPLGKLDVKNLELLANLKPNLGETVLIGVRLSDLELTDGVWSIRLDPKSGVLMTRWAALGSMGWPVTERAAEDTEAAKP